MLEILYFTAPWCGPCRAFKPVFNEVISSFAGQITTNIIDVDSNQELAQKYNISGIPALVFIKNGQVINQSKGIMPKASLISLIQQNK